MDDMPYNERKKVQDGSDKYTWQRCLSLPERIRSHAEQAQIGWQGSYSQFPQIIRNEQLEVGVEIGVAFAGHANSILSTTKVGRLYGVDPYRHLPDYDDDMNMSQMEFDQLYRFVIQRMLPFGSRYVHVRAPSAAAATVVPNNIDFVYIDADHSYEGVLDDIRLWLPKVRPGGVIAGHDYNHPAHPGVACAVTDVFRPLGWTVNIAGGFVWWVKVSAEIDLSGFTVSRRGQSCYQEGLAGHSLPHVYRPDRANSVRCTASPNSDQQPLRILLGYKREPSYMAEMINVALRKRFPQIEVFACGPNNEFHLPNDSRLYDGVATLCDHLGIDVYWELESGDFGFGAAPGPMRALKLWWLCDSHQYLELMLAKASSYDRVFVTMKDDLASFGAKAIWLPGCASADLHIDYHVPRVHDLSFIGSLDSLHRDRVDLIKGLVEEFPQMNVRQNLFMDDMAFELSQTKLAFNKSLSGDLNYRVFEAMACGALLITDRIENGLGDLFVDGEHLVCYDGRADLFDKVRWYLDHPLERERIARAGQFAVLEGHLVDHRLQKVMDELPALVRKHRRSLAEAKV